MPNARTGSRVGPGALLALALLAGLAVAVPAAADTCFPDSANDTVLRPKTDPDVEPRAANDARADLLRHCAVLTKEHLRLSARTATPTDPVTDPGWASAHTGLSWHIDTDLSDEDPEFLVSFRRREGAASARVFDDAGAARCDGTASYDGADYGVVIEAACIGGATEIALGVSLSYDPAPDDPDAELYQDTVALGTRRFGRIAGAGRFETAVRIGGYAFPDRAGAVYLAGAGSTADAVVAGSLTDGPILLVPQCAEEVPEHLRNALAKYDPDEVVALGGDAAVCDELLSAAASGRRRVRLSGESRLGTAAAVSRRGFPGGSATVYLAEAAAFADAVSGGSLREGPILLVPSSTPVPEVVLDEIARLAPDEVVALGGTGAIPDAVLAEAAGGRAQRRIAGRTRIETAAAIAAESFPGRAQEVYLARADVLVDAVVAGTLTKGPVLLVPTFGQLPEAVRAAIVRMGPVRVMALGGPGAVSEAVLHDAAAAS